MYHVCKMFGRQWTNEAKIAIFNDHTLIWRPLSSEPPRISAQTLYCQKLRSLGYIFIAGSIWVALQIFQQFCPKAGDTNPLVAKPETDFNAKRPFKVIYFGISVAWKRVSLALEVKLWDRQTPEGWVQR